MIMNIETWFPTSIYYDDLGPDEEVSYNMFSFIESFYEKKKDLKPNFNNITGDVTGDYCIHNDSTFDWLNRQVSIACKAYLTALGIDLDYISFHIQKSWPVVCVGNGGHVNQHKHTNSALSVVFYVECETNDTGKIVFLNPHDILVPVTPRTGTGNELSYTNCSYSPVKNRLLVFPSLLHHKVEPYYSDIPRYSVSYDIMVTSNKMNNESMSSDPSLWKNIT
tara:strand:+ start:191 stop:856 length:666 start_codon:yes stop_codon:yes gene_type:complete